MSTSDPSGSRRHRHTDSRPNGNCNELNSALQRLSRSKDDTFESAPNSASVSLSSNMSSGSGGRNFMASMSLIFNMEFQYEQLQLMKDKLQSSNGDVYATFMAEKLKKSFGLRALPSLTESQPVITFEGDTDDDVSFTLIYFNSQETSPLNYILKHYFGSQFITLMNEVYTLLYNNTLNTSASCSEISEGENGFNRIDDIDDMDPEIEEEKDSVSAAGEDFPSEDMNNSIPNDTEALNMDEDMSTIQKEAINGEPHSSPVLAKVSNTGVTTTIVTNPQIVDRPRVASISRSSGEISRSNYSIKYCDTNKLILNKKVGSSSTVLNDFNSLPGRGLREHLLFSQNHPNATNKRIYTPDPKALAVTPKHSKNIEAAISPRIDMSPSHLVIDDQTDPDWSPASSTKRKPFARRSSDHLRTALMAFKTPSEGDHLDPNATKKWVCNFKNCGKTFSVRSHLDTHKVTHTGEKRYICNVCGGRFTQSSSLRNHRIAIHTKEYPHNCNICKKGFLLPSQLKKHKISYHSSRKHLSNSTSNHANALAAKILATAKTVQTVPPVPTLWPSRIENSQSEN